MRQKQNKIRESNSVAAFLVHPSMTVRDQRVLAPAPANDKIVQISLSIVRIGDQRGLPLGAFGFIGVKLRWRHARHYV